MFLILYILSIHVQDCSKFIRGHRYETAENQDMVLVGHHASQVVLYLPGDGCRRLLQ